MNNGNQSTAELCQNCTEQTGKRSKASARDFPRNHIGATEGEIEICPKCLEYQTTRTAHLQEILNSDADRRIVVAGPGTGKSHTFKEVLKNRDGGPAVVFTLINNLVNDLRVDLGDIDEEIKVFSFHAFCVHILHSKVPIEGINNEFELYSGLYEILKADAELMNEGVDGEFSRHFANLEIEDPSCPFLLQRAAYYNAAWFDDLVFRVFDYFNDNQDKIPSFKIVIGDEFQDFNLLEASFIRLLGQPNKLLLAGDDDQSLYGFRHASNRFIRDLAGDGDFLKLELPYCSRCTPVIVESTNHFISEAKKKGKLEGRLDKGFESYWPDKYADQNQFPFIEVADCTTAVAGQAVILEKIVALAETDGDQLRNSKDVPFLVVGPEDSYRQRNLAKFLETRLDPEIFEIEWSDKEKSEITIEDGYRILERGVNTNLGWRIVLHADPVDNLAELLIVSRDKGTPLEELLPEEYKQKHRAVFAEPEKGNDESSSDEVKEEKKKIRIKITNYLGSKGLSALHTFIIGLKNGVFPRDPKAITDEEICKFIVALTRAKKSCTLITNPEFNFQLKKPVRAPSIFFDMLPDDKLEGFRCSVKEGQLVRKKIE